MQVSSLHRSPPPGDPRRRGAALLLSLFVLIVILAVAFQIKISTSTDARVARNDQGLTKMDLAIESVFLDYFETLRNDAEAGAAEGGGGGETSAPVGGALGGALGGAAAAAGGETGGEGEESPSDSRQDEWARTRRLEINGVELEIRVEPENAKYNVLSLLTENDDEAEKAFDRVVRVIDLFREGTAEDVDRHEARAMAEAMLEHMRERRNSLLPRPRLLTFDEEQEDVGLPITLREFAVLEPFEPWHFQHYRDEDGNVVHSLSSFLTVWSSLQTREELEDEGESQPGAGGEGEQDGEGEDGEGEDGEGGREDGRSGGGTGGAGAGGGGQVGDTGRSVGGASAAGSTATGSGPSGAAATSLGHRVNVNLAPRAVLFALMDDADVPYRFWDAIVEHRNTEDEEASGGGDEDDEPLLDEYGEEVVPYLYFSSVDELADMDEWNNLEPIVQTEIQDLLTTQSDVFSVTVTARRATGVDGGAYVDWTDRDAIEDRRESGSNLVRVVRCTVWRRGASSSVQIVPLERWEVLDHLVYEVEDFPEGRRWRR